MSKIFALLALLLILTGAVLLAVPRDGAGSNERSIGPEAAAIPVLVTQARDIAEKVNAPLSIVFGLVSLFYSRRSYQVNKQRADSAGRSGRSA
jgi:hypothetical protein